MIPPTFHQIWLGGELPLELAEYMESWRRLHPAWTHCLWTEENLPPLTNQDLFDNASEISPGAVEQFQSDVLRYELLERYGGVYVDADFECLKPIDHLRDCNFLGWVTRTVLNNALLGFEMGHPFLREVIESLPGNVARFKPEDGNTHKSGPLFITPIALRYKSVQKLPKDLLYPYDWKQLHRKGEVFPDSLAVHHWNNRRRLNAEKQSRGEEMDLRTYSRG
jgi:inositol phosphorylceramide mannosyltransferase catalytic subunit